ncbi:helix-turn-helix transcriptional regulator [Gordonia sp. YC-JH1]|uniref:helix-turn-helix transcriptional regulator n=1 Tax=Gordonia sp. YC-JH1 TaxID=2059875 RepID=UPI001F35191B|nr:helix-turn-helix domain-containing protein [Gordonia sp. YC-JH1]
MRTTILDTLRAAAAPMTVAEVAEATDIPQTTVRFHLRALTADGLIVVDTAEHDGPGRPRLLYRARPAMDPSGPRNYGILAEVLLRTLADTPDAAARAVAAGREWGRPAAPVPTNRSKICSPYSTISVSRPKRRATGSA